LHAGAEYFAVRSPKKRAIIPVDIAVVQIADLQEIKRIAPEDSPEHLMREPVRAHEANTNRNEAAPS
jgi:hypothetical protein